MPDVRAQQLKALREAEQKLYNLDDAIVNRIAVMYDSVRRDITTTLLDWYNRNGAPMDPDQLRVMAAEVDRIREIERAIKRLSSDVADYLNDKLPDAQAIGLDNAEREVARMARFLDVKLDPQGVFTGIDDQLAVMVESVVQQIPNIVLPLANQITFELQYSLTQGDSFTQIVQRLAGADLGPAGASFFRRGELSMSLFTRRSVIDANNASRQLVYENAQDVLPDLQKQAIAAVDSKTTDCCLKVNGQIRSLDQPYHLTGTPRFADEVMFPTFHWNCRTSSVAYHPAFEEGSSATTASFKEAARAEMKRREEEGSAGATN